jgi:hypothetical protein
MRGFGFKLHRRMKSLLPKPIKGEGMSSLNQEIRFGFTCAKKDSQPIERTKWHPRGDGPFQILEKNNDNAYKVDLPGEYNVSATFNASDLSPYDAGDNLRLNPFEERGNDGPMVDRILKIPCKFQMGQSQGQERRRSRKQCKDWCNPLGPSLQIYRARPQHSRWS